MIVYGFIWRNLGYDVEYIIYIKRAIEIWGV